MQYTYRYDRIRTEDNPGKNQDCGIKFIDKGLRDNRFFRHAMKQCGNAKKGFDCDGGGCKNMSVDKLNTFQLQLAVVWLCSTDKNVACNAGVFWGMSAL